MDNVSIRMYRDGVLEHEHIGHNVWTQDGLTTLAKLVSFASYGPDVPFSNDRLKYMGFGVGGIRQTALSVSDAAPISTLYPAGFNTPPSDGDQYNPLYPISPLIRSLERPIIFSVGAGPAVYPGGAGDQYLTTAIVSFPSPTVVEFMVPVTLGATRFLFGTISQLPLSEIGLFFNTAVPTDAFNTGKLAAYHSFDTLLLTAGLYVEFTWRVSV